MSRTLVIITRVRDIRFFTNMQIIPGEKKSEKNSDFPILETFSGGKPLDIGQNQWILLDFYAEPQL